MPREAYATRPVYHYPISDPYAATVITLPPDMRVNYSDVPETNAKTMTVFEGRDIPEGFWYQDGLKYGQLIQSQPAPLVFIIPGTGADYRADIMRTVAEVLYTAGNSVVLLPSPSNPNFIINSSENAIPGSPKQDARDLYRVMRMISSDVSKHATVTENRLVGYSLGGWQAAFTAQFDSQQRALNFSKVLLINPPLSLYSSMKILDDDLNRALPHGMNDADAFIKTEITRLSRVSTSGEAFDFRNAGLLVDYYNRFHPSDDRLATMIGLSFRLSAADMIFTSDVMRRSGYIFPRDQNFTTSTSVNAYMAIALRSSFSDYLNDVFYEEAHAKDPSISKQDLIAQSNLLSLESYIVGNDKLRLITNRDDIVLAPGDLATLERLFQNHEVIFPIGGHLGNIATPAIAYQIKTFMPAAKP